MSLDLSGLSTQTLSQTDVIDERDEIAFHKPTIRDIRLLVGVLQSCCDGWDVRRFKKFMFVCIFVLALGIEAVGQFKGRVVGITVRTAHPWCGALRKDFWASLME